MGPLRARVRDGRLILDEPTTLPEGTVVELVESDEGDDLGAEDREALHAALKASINLAKAGRVSPASVIVDEISRRK